MIVNVPSSTTWKNSFPRSQSDQHLHLRTRLPVSNISVCFDEIYLHTPAAAYDVRKVQNTRRTSPELDGAYYCGHWPRVYAREISNIRHPPPLHDATVIQIIIHNIDIYIRIFYFRYWPCQQFRDFKHRVFCCTAMVRLQVIAFGPAMVQLAKSINNLKICWKQIQAAPEDIQQLIRDVEMFGLILTEVEGGVDARFVDRPRLTDQKSILWCKEASEELDILVRSLRRDMDSSSQIPGSAKMAIPKNKIEEYRSRLKNAIRLLLSTQQCYTRFVTTTSAQKEID